MEPTTTDSGGSKIKRRSKERGDGESEAVKRLKKKSATLKRIAKGSMEAEDYLSNKPTRLMDSSKEAEDIYHTGFKKTMLQKTNSSDQKDDYYTSSSDDESVDSNPKEPTSSNGSRLSLNSDQTGTPEKLNEHSSTSNLSASSTPSNGNSKETLRVKKSTLSISSQRVDAKDLEELRNHYLKITKKHHSDLKVWLNPIFGRHIAKDVVFGFERGRRTIARASVRFIIESIASDFATATPDYLDTVLLTHPVFIDSLTFMQKLTDHFWEGGKKARETELEYERKKREISEQSEAPDDEKEEFSEDESTFDSSTWSSSEPPSRRGTIDLGSNAKEVFNSVVAAVAPSVVRPPPQPEPSWKPKNKYEQVQYRLVKAFARWIEFRYMKQQEKLCNFTLDFIEKLLASSYDYERKWGAHLRQKFKDMEEKEDKLEATVAVPKMRRSFTLGRTARISVITVDPLEFAKHLTARDWNIFRQVSPVELLNNAWTSEEREKRAPHLSSLVSEFNYITHWVASEILLTSNNKDRVAILKRFIKLAKNMKDLQNFHGMIEIQSALNMICIQRLSHVWKEVSSKYKNMLKDIQKVADAGTNWKNYRELVSKAKPPFIPFEGVLFGDFAGIQENEDKVQGLINVEKLKLFGNGLRLIKKAQTEQYNFTESQILARYLHHAVVLDEDQLFQLSYKILPPQGQI